VERASRLVGLEGMLEQPEMTDAVLIACVTRHRLLALCSLSDSIALRYGRDDFAIEYAGAALASAILT